MCMAVWPWALQGSEHVVMTSYRLATYHERGKSLVAIAGQTMHANDHAVPCLPQSILQVPRSCLPQYLRTSWSPISPVPVQPTAFTASPYSVTSPHQAQVQDSIKHVEIWLIILLSTAHSSPTVCRPFRGCILLWSSVALDHDEAWTECGRPAAGWVVKGCSIETDERWSQGVGDLKLDCVTFYLTRGHYSNNFKANCMCCMQGTK